MTTELVQPSTLLIVDDDPSTLLLSAKPLQEAGYVVLQAAGSSEALRLCAERTQAVDLVLADIFLPPPGFQLSVDKNPYPRVNGLEVAERLLEGHPETRVILMSCSPSSDLLSRGLIRDGLPFLRKPFTSAALLALVRQVLAGPLMPANPKKPAPSRTGDVEWFD